MAASQQALLRAGLPALPLVEAMHTQDAILRGRNPYEGYQRSVGLEYADLAERVAAHPLYQAALARAQGRTVMTVHRLMNLFLILTLFSDRLESQDVVEFGSFRGGSLLFIGTVLQRIYPKARVWGFDTFAGMPVTDASVDLHKQADFAETSVQEVRAALDAAGLDNVTLVPGLVQDLSLIHI